MNELLLTCHVTGEDVDYQSGPYNVTFTAGKISTVLFILINDDEILEDGEIFNIAIIGTSFSRVTIGLSDQSGVFIMDNESK